MTVSENPNRKYYRRESVVVNFPGQARAVQAQRLEIPAGIPMQAAPGKFQPFRLVINLQMVDADQPDSEVLDFDPPVEVRIRYTAEDYAHARREGKPLSLGFWDGSQWIRFTAEKHQFHLEPGSPPEAGGWGVVSVSRWADPTHAWGT